MGIQSIFTAPSENTSQIILLKIYSILYSVHFVGRRFY